LSGVIFRNGLIFAGITIGYLLAVMLLFSPRIWGYQDYPSRVKAKVPPQTRRERLLAAVIGLPWFIFLIAFPIYSTYQIKADLGGAIPFGIAFANLFFMTVLVELGDVVLLDWLLVSRVTPRFVIIPGSQREDYRDFSEHFRSHGRAALILVGVDLLIALIVWLV
jgi:hypothetical protein